MSFNENNLDIARKQIASLVGDVNVLSKDEIDDYAKIRLLFGSHNLGLVKEQLKLLEQQLQNDVKEKFSIEYAIYLEKLNQDKKHHKILSNFLLGTWAKENGFNSGVAPHNDLSSLPASAPKIGEILPAAVFINTLLAYAYLFKDLGVAAAHGEFVHALQWYLIIEINKRYKFLKEEPLNLYRKLAHPLLNYLNQQGKIEINGDTQLQSLWDYLVDTNVLGGEDYGSSSFYWNEHFRLTEEYPLLRALFLTREEKHAIAREKRLKKLKANSKLFVRHDIFWQLPENCECNIDEKNVSAVGLHKNKKRKVDEQLQASGAATFTQ